MVEVKDNRLIKRVYAVKASPYGEPFAAFTTRGAAFACYETLARAHDGESRSTDYIVELPVFGGVTVVGGDD